MNVDETTTIFLEAIQSKVSTALYNAWFKNMQIMDLSSATALLYIDSDFKKKKILDNKAYSDIIENALKEATQKDYSFELVTDQITNETINANYEDKSSIATSMENIMEIVNNNVDNIEDINKENLKINSNLDKSLTFENYMISKVNLQAQAIALEVAKNPGQTFNPFFLYGNSGTGKTHLMQAIGNYIVEHSDKVVLYITSADFISEYIDATRNDYSFIKHFKDKYKNIDVLIIDDIQMMAEAKKTQDEFFNIIDEMHRLKKQIIISSDKAPNSLNKFDPRLITRFSNGIAYDIKPPDIELKIKILKNKTMGTLIHTMMSNDIYEYIANNTPADTRSLNNAVNRLLVNATLMQPDIIDINFVRTSLGEVFESNEYLTNDLARIRKTVADYYDVTEESLKSKKRTADINKARQVAWYISSVITEETIVRIGLEYNRNHATVLHGIEVIQNQKVKDIALENEIKEIKDKLTE